MTKAESVREILEMLSTIKPNEVVSLSDGAGKLFQDTVAELQEKGVI